MSKYEQQIIDTVRLQGTVSVAALAEQLDVTDQTIRRIVRPLVDKGQVKKVHGAIITTESVVDAPLTARLAENRQEKAIIARAVADTIEDEAILAIDSGSTSGFIARALTRRKNLTVVTNSAFVASTLSVIEGNRIFFAGAQLRSHDGAAFDKAAFDVVSKFVADYSILTVSLVHPRLGFLLNDQSELDMAREMIQISARSIMAVDHTKWQEKNIRSPFRLPSLRAGDYVFTDTEPEPAYSKLLRDLDVKIGSGSNGYEA